MRGTLGLLANTLPEVALIATVGILLYNFIVKQETPGLFALSLVILVPLMVVAIFHLLILLLLPVRWPAIRDRFRDKLGKRLDEELERVFRRSRSRSRTPCTTNEHRSKRSSPRRRKSPSG